MKKRRKQPAYSRIKYHERHTIMLLIRRGESIYSIAQTLGRSYSAVYNEVKKGEVDQWTRRSRYAAIEKIYDSDFAQLVTEQRAQLRGADVKIGKDHETAETLADLLKGGYSPYAALEVMKKENWLKTEICPRTVYNYIYQGILAVEEDVLIYGRRRRHKHVPFNKRKNAFSTDPEYVSIEQRPLSVLSREEFGHWEGDTVMSHKGDTGAFFTLIERQSRFSFVEKIPDRTTNSVVEALDTIERKLGCEVFREVFKSITFDNGVEFQDIAGMKRSYSRQHGAENRLEHIYFAHPYCSGERGSNENLHRFLRRKWPKGYPLSKVDPEELAHYVNWINNYPRKIHFGKSASEMFDLRGL